MATEKRQDTRCRTFATVVYPDSAPDGWQDLLSGMCIPAMISPLHDKDLNPDGTPKKPHWHVILAFEGKKSVEQVDKVIKAFNGVGIVKINSVRGYARYLCHLDNPEKVQYPTEDVIALSGADFFSYIGLPTDKYKAVSEMIAFCKEKDIYSYSALLEYAQDQRYDWFRVLCDSATMVMKEYLKSRSWTHGKGQYSDRKDFSHE